MSEEKASAGTGAKKSNTTLIVVALVLGALLVSCAFCCFVALLGGGTADLSSSQGQDSQEVSEENVDEDADQQEDVTEEVEETQQKDPDPIPFSGTGDTVTRSFELKEGYSLVEATHTGSSNFILSAIPTEGTDDLLVNEIGSYSGTTLLEVTDTQNYMLEITADGAWTIKITQPTKTDITVPTTLSGTGDSVKLVIFPDGNRKMTISHDGRSNFIVQVHDLEAWMDLDSLIVNEIGNYSGSNLYGKDGEGLVYIEVVADGNWKIAVE